MKSNLMFVLTAIMCACVMSKSLCAQGSSSVIEVGVCSLSGPSVSDTLKYINDNIDWRGAGSEIISVEGQNIVTRFSSFFNGSQHDSAVFAPAYALNCRTRGTETGGPNPVTAFCISGVCATDQESDGSRLGQPTLELFYRGDADQGSRLSRAFSHLIALLQKQYKDSHSNPNDPFAKPQ